MTKILLIGNGAREHVLAETIVRSLSNVELYAFMSAKNPGIAGLAKDIKLGSHDAVDEICSFAAANKIDLAVIGPEAPLAAGVVDALEEKGIASFGPKKNLARLETSKSFTRNLLVKYGIDCYPKFKVFTAIAGAREFMEELNGEFVVKADGLKGGKGVKVTGDHLKNIDEGLAYAKECIEDAGKVIIEEKLVGEEFSLQCITDGTTIIPTPPAQDHKRAYEGDTGPNTGGMGSYSRSNHLLPFMKESELEKAYEITKKVCDALYQECGEKYKGVMYGGFIITKNGVKLIEYNARFGDPEAMNVLPILKTDFVELCRAVIEERLHEITVEFANVGTVCKYIVPEGYPDHPLKGEKVDLGALSEDDARVYYAAVEERGDGLYMLGSRAVAFVGIAKNFWEAEKMAEKAASNVSGKVFYRKDIGANDLIHKKIKRMEEIRGS